ncbi:unnamed protein product [Clonostachys byssicola]|uniref:Uncharacterized protein n=1 Tax=Clonostachys byssicola TaxID=160290 RepID=A0A9N9YCJ0_9HYPO|nr:unnamed protein product [Clonostachys byssicola]
MSSLVSDFIINPVLRQARRFSEASRATLSGSRDETKDSDQLNDNPMTDDEAHHDEPAIARVVSSESATLRPLSSSTQETRVEEPIPAQTPPRTTPMVLDGSPTDHLGFPISKRRNSLIPEDDGMRELRKRIHAIHARDIEAPEKARLMHDALLENYNSSRVTPQGAKTPEAPRSPVQRPEQLPSPQGPLESLKFWQNQPHEALGPSPADFVLTELDRAPSFAPVRRPKTSGIETPHIEPALSSVTETVPQLGCPHYERNVKLQCATCDKWYPCRLCHDNEEDHNLPRFETKHMLCMLCETPQKVSDVCINCGELAASYYCGVCKLWENRQSKPIYHCSDCGICRRGFGLGKDYVHCKTCCACIPTSIELSHKCIERSTDCDCPICGEYMFSSPRPVVFMACGHSIHKKCYDQHMRSSYKCPICNKSLANMETHFRNLDVAIQGQPMPPEFRDTKAVILCNDCSGRSTVPYHWLGLKCSICRSYNTAELQILGGTSRELQAALAETSEEAGPDAAQPSVATAPITESRDGVSIAGRRRHSSRGIELQRRASEIIVGSFPPITIRYDSHLGQIPSDSESEGGMLGFWGGAIDDDDSDYQDDSSNASESEEEDDDDDIENDLILIGHR